MFKEPKYDILTPYAKRLRDAVEAKGYKRTVDLANDLGIPNSTLANYLTYREMPYDVLIKVSRLLGVSIDWLITGEYFGENDEELAILRNQIKGIKNILGGDKTTI